MFGRKANKISDEKLMQLICSGNQDAFNELYDRYNERLYYYFFRMLGNSSELANDFLQEVFLKIIEKPERFNPGYSFTAWLFTIAHNLCKNEYRRRDVRKEISHTGENLADETHTLFKINKEEIVTQIYNSLNDLKPEQRSVFLLFYREGFSINEIAEILELPKGTVKSRLHYTRKFLEERFEHLKDEIEF